MKKILETKKDYEKLQRAPRPGEKVRSDLCTCADQQSLLTDFKVPSHLLVWEDRKLGAPPVCPGWGLRNQGQRPVLL